MRAGRRRCKALSLNGIVIPTFFEAELVIEAIRNREEFVIQGKSFFKGYLNNAAVALVVCGMGKTNAAQGSALLFERFNPSGFIVLGVGGAYPSCGLEIGDIAVAESEIYGDEGLRTEAGIQTMDALQLPLASVGQKNYYNEFPLYIPETIKNHEHTGVFVTVSACTGSTKAGFEIGKRFNAICENMEGAAVAHIGVLNNMPVAEIRGISNVIEDRKGKPLDRTALLMAAEKVQRFFMEKVLHMN